MRQPVLAVLVLLLLSSVMVSRADSSGSRDTSSLILEQTQRRKKRPRRVETESPPGQQEPIPAESPGPPPELREGIAPAPPRPAVPHIRVALATDVASAAIACDGEIIRIEETSGQVVHLGESEVHLEPMLPQDGPLKIYRVRVDVATNQKRAEQLAEQLRSQFREEVVLKADGESVRQLVYLGRFGNEVQARDFALRVKRAGYRNARPVDDLAPPAPMVAARSAGNELLLRAPSHLTLASADEASALLKFNGRAYRGRLLVQLNQWKRLTVINEVPLEEYLWSVVPNELGPAKFPQLEALKAQAIAARTYAVAQKLKATPADGYDLLPDVRSQVYTGVDAEHPLSTQAVNETRGLVVTYDGEPIEAVYTSTCGGKTENSEFIFNEPRPYLRSVHCAPEARWLATRAIVRRHPILFPQPAALFRVLGWLPANVKPDRLSAPASAGEIEQWLAAAATMMKRPEALSDLDTKQLARLDGFARAVVALFYPEGYAEAMLTPADVDYILDYADGVALSPEGRVAVAVLVRDGLLGASDVSRLNPGAAPARLEALTALARLFERVGVLPLKEGVTRSLSGQQVIIESDGEEARSYELAEAAWLFKQLGQEKLPVERLVVVGGERVWFHLDAAGRIDYLELRPNPAGVAHDRYSPVSQWEVRMTPSELTRQLRRRGVEVGQVVDVKVMERGASHRAIKLEVVGTRGRTALNRSAIRSALGLRENLFVIDRTYNWQGRVAVFRFLGRGWGHGVGLCQVGAYGLALEGLTYPEILKTYYTGVEITKIYQSP